MRQLNIYAGDEAKKFVVITKIRTNEEHYYVNYTAETRKKAEVLAGHDCVAIWKIKKK